MRWLMYSLPARLKRDALSAWKPRIGNGKDSSRPSSSGTRKRAEMPTTAPTNSYWVIVPNEAVGLVPVPGFRVHRFVAFHEGAKVDRKRSLPDCG